MSAFVYRATASPQEAANWTRRQIVATNLRSVVGRAYPRVTGLLREKSWVFFEIALPFLATSTFVFVYRAVQAPPCRTSNQRPAGSDVPAPGRFR